MKKRKEQKNSTRFVISTNNLIIWSYSKKICVRLLKGDANPLTYSITSDVKNKNNNSNNNNKSTNKETSKIKQIRHDSTLEVNNTLFNDK